jgi:ribosomal protein S18 acetylase RimI-like enzyme
LGQQPASQCVQAKPAATICDVRMIRQPHDQNGRSIMLESVAIRRAETVDVESIGRVASEVGASGGIESDLVAGLFDDPAVFTYLAEVDDTFGFVTAGHPMDADVYDKGVGEIIGLAVLPRFRCFGIGSKLLVHGLTVLKLRGYLRAAAWLPDAEPRSRELFERLRFTSTGMSRAVNHPSGRTIEQSSFEVGLDDYF